MTLIGVDGCPGGWAVVRADDHFREVRFDIVKDIAEVFQEDAIIGIDIPIGLPNSGPRACDREARQVLEPKQRSRVFPAPTRAALAGCSYLECCALNEQACGKRLSKQSHAIIPKIREVDSAITPELQGRVREAHPEVSFRLINGAPLLHSKKKAEGLMERLMLLHSAGVQFDPVEERLRLGRGQVALDDLIDAAVCIVTARRIAAGRARVIGHGERDARGLRMEIVA